MHRHIFTWEVSEMVCPELSDFIFLLVELVPAAPPAEEVAARTVLMLAML